MERGWNCRNGDGCAIVGEVYAIAPKVAGGNRFYDKVDEGIGVPGSGKLDGVLDDLVCGKAPLFGAGERTGKHFE